MNAHWFFQLVLQIAHIVSFCHLPLNAFKKVTTCVRWCEKNVKMKDSYCCFPFHWLVLYSSLSFFCASESETVKEWVGESKWILFSLNLQWNQSGMNRSYSMCASLVLLHTKMFKRIVICLFQCVCEKTGKKCNRKCWERAFHFHGVCMFILRFGGKILCFWISCRSFIIIITIV